MDRQEIAKAAGWESDPVETKVISSEVASSTEVGLLDAEDHIAPQFVDQDRPFWSRPMPRIVAVSIPATLGLWGLVSMVGGNRPQQVAQNSTPTPSLTPTPTAPTEDAGNLRTRLALQSQANQLQQQAKKAPQARATPQVAKTPIIRSASPAVVQPTRSAAIAPQVPARSSSRTSSVPQVVRVVSTPAVSKPARDPMQAWLSAADIGNYGSVAVKSNTANASISVDDVSGGVGLPPPGSTTPATTPPVTATFESTPTAQIAIGTRAQGTLETPIAWTEAINNPVQNFLVRLQEPIKSADGAIALPSGAALVVKVTNATNSGFAQLEATSAIVPENGRNVEKSLPEHAVLILGSGGKPLQASRDRASHFGTDLGAALLSGASRAAGLINQPQSQIVTNGTGGIQSTTTNSNPNLAAGVIEGVTQSLLKSQLDRAQQSHQAANNQSSIFVLGQGTSVQVFVNQLVSL
jgi:hypothetical protein